MERVCDQVRGFCAGCPRMSLTTTSGRREVSRLLARGRRAGTNKTGGSLFGQEPISAKGWTADQPKVGIIGFDGFVMLTLGGLANRILRAR